ncbi:MAG: hypothetical protein R3300_20600 [Candidatus Promineifilaceae bacterium]|nr:hypothetical protein [Candidatus Promineifilaceae bacterium]
MNRVRVASTLALIIVFVALTFVIRKAGAADAGPKIAERLPRGVPTSPLTLERLHPQAAQHRPVPNSAVPLRSEGDWELTGWTRLVFQSARNLHDYNVFLATPFTDEIRRQLTTHGAHDISPRLNRGATQVVFSSSRDGNWEIYRIGANGHGLSRLTHHGAVDAFPDWSPEGNRVVFASNRNGQFEIYVMNKYGGDLRRLTTHPAYDGEPSWSPDGEKIAFVSNRGGDYGIWSMNPDGSDVELVADSHFSGGPAWSPDSETIAYHADNDRDGWYDIHTVNADGTQGLRLFSPGLHTDAFVSSWSPDGRYIAATEVYWSQYEGDWYWLWARPSYIKRDDGRSLSLYDTDWDMDWYPDWQTTDTEPPVSEITDLLPYSRNDIFIEWDAWDIGGAGVAEVLAQYRMGEDGNWAALADGNFMDCLWWHCDIAKQSGKTLYLRVRATDRAGNTEDWASPAGDTQTTFYDWLIQGRISDNRGQPVPEGMVQAGPEAFEIHPSDSQGAYRAYFQGGDHLFWSSWGKEGYGTAVETAFGSAADRNMNVYLPPADNVVADSGFESETLDASPWQSGGHLTPTVEAARRYTGENGLFLGLPFDMNPPTPLSEGTDGSCCNYRYILSDEMGTMHLVWSENSDGNDLFYYISRQLGSEWSVPVALNAPGGNLEYDWRWAVAPTGEVHLVWGEWVGGYDIVYHVWRNAAGIWSEPTIVQDEGSVQLFGLEADSQGDAHLLWRLDGTDHDGTYYSRFDVDGTWSEPAPLGIPMHWRIVDVTVGPEDGVHLLSESGDTSYYSYLRGDGTWSSPETATQDEDLWLGHRLLLDWRGRAHVVVHTNRDRILHRSRTSDGVWSPVSVVSGSISTGYYFDVLVDDQDVLHAVFVGRDGCSDGGNGAYYTRTDPDGNWLTPTAPYGADLCVGWSQLQKGPNSVYMLVLNRSDESFDFCLGDVTDGTSATPACIEGLAGDRPQLFMDSRETLHVVWRGPSSETSNELYYSQPLAAETNESSAVTQRVTIPLTLTHPTLSLVYSLHGGQPGSEATLSAQIEGDGDPVAVRSVDEAGAWSQAWADVSTWAGQTVTLTILAKQQAGVPRLSALVDDVTLGSAPPDLWTLLESPTNAPSGEQFQLTIHYGNRAASPASGVQISLTLPAGISFVSADLTPVTSGPVVRWDVGHLAAGSLEQPIVVTATMEAAYKPGLWLPLRATIAGAEPEIEMANNAYVRTVMVGHLLTLPVIRR